MIVKAQKLQALLDKRGLTRKDFADKLGVDVTEVDKMLGGERIGYDTARKFVYYLKADRAQHLIDWDKLGVENPLAKDCEDDYGDAVKEDAE